VGAGQLEEELAAGLVALDAEDADVFSDDPSLLWKRCCGARVGAGGDCGLPADPRSTSRCSASGQVAAKAALVAGQ